jgi:hypothetical protein
MKGQVLTTFSHKGQNFVEGETRVIDDKDGEYFCRAGWFKDDSGKVSTATPNSQDVVLEVEDVTTIDKSEVVNG